MAQAVFDQHPLEQYLQDVGETQDFMPGSSFDLDLELEPVHHSNSEEDDTSQTEWRPLFLIKLLEVCMAVVSAAHPTNQPSPFVERFKYDVISSSLLSVTLPSTHVRTPRPSSFPGQLDHSRSSSIDSDITAPPPPTPPSQPSYLIPSLSLLLFAIFLNTGCTFLTIGSFAITVYTLRTMDEPSKHDTSPSLQSLSDMIAAIDEWEFVVQEAINVLENEERSTSSSSSPSSSIRITLGSSLITTQTQCDNIRHLFSALTSPSEVSQLAEMYAPPSPSTPLFSRDLGSRPLSLPTRGQTSSPLSDRYNKRQTWNGSHSRLSRTTSPATHVRENRRSHLPSLLHSPSHPSLTSISAPVTPSHRSLSPSPAPLPLVNEDDIGSERDQISHAADETLSFGAAALELRRHRMSAGMESFAPSSAFHPPSTPPTSSTALSGCRFTPIQAARHPHSVSALTQSLQGALASKRYACSHLLALRFTDEEDEGYWEDVRSVMGLLTSTFLDASAGLSEVLHEVEQQKLRDSNPTPFEDTSFEKLQVPIRKNRRTQAGNVSFAPLPSQLSRFMGHVEAMHQALDDARDNLEQCVASLRDESEGGSVAGRRARKRKRISRLSVGSEDGPMDEGDEEEVSCSLETYERLRRELGLALRECERGRERLLDVVFPSDDNADDEDSSLDDLPGLGHDASDDTDKHDLFYPFDDDVEQHLGAHALVASPETDGVDVGIVDDATPHLLLATSTQGLPLPGLEQVFEADSGNVGAFKRERSKLTREERIQLVRARRESDEGGVLGLGIDVCLSTETTELKKGGVEKWGPGGEVVQELKDVIWKVGERRRKMVDAASAAASPLDSGLLAVSVVLPS